MNGRSFGGLPGLAAARVLPGLLDQAGVGLAALDGDGKLCMLSASLQEMLGQPFAPVPAAMLPEVYHLYTGCGARRLASGETPLARARTGETIVDALVVVKAPGRPLRHLRCNAVPLPAAGGNFSGALAVIEDVTQATAGSPTFGRARDDLVQSINHELRTPLTIILGHIEMLEDDNDDLPPRALVSLEAVRRAGQRLQVVADELATLPKVPEQANLPPMSGRRSRPSGPETPE